VGLFDDGVPANCSYHGERRFDHWRLMDTIGTLVSLALQYGVPLETLVKKFAHQRRAERLYEESDIPIAKSISDYLFRWLGCQFIPGYREANSPNAGQPELPLKERRGAGEEDCHKPVGRPRTD